MTDGEVVLCDSSNLCLKFLSDSFTTKESLQLDSETAWRNCSSYVTISNVLIGTSVLQTN